MKAIFLNPQIEYSISHSMSYKINIDGFIGDSGFMGGDCFTMKDLNRALDAMPTNTKVVDVIINSGGGYVTEGFAIHDRLATLEQVVNTETLGICGSIATVIGQAPKSQDKGGLRSGYQNSDYFIHNPSWSPQSPEPMEAEELQRIATDLLNNQEKLINFYALTTGKAPELFKAKMIEAKSLSMDEAKDLGLIDKIISTNIQAATIYKFAAHISKPISPMSNFLENFKAEFAKFKNEVIAIVKPVTKNETVKTSEGIDIFYSGDLTEGTKVYTDVEMTKPAPDGVHTVGTKLYTVAGGEVTKIEDLAMDDKKKLEVANAEVEKLKAQLAAKDGEVTAKIDAAIASKETELTAKLTSEVTKAVTEKETALNAEFQNKMTAFENKYFTGGKFKPEFIQAMKEEGTEKPDDYAGKSSIEIAQIQKNKRAEAEKAAAEKK